MSLKNHFYLCVQVFTLLSGFLVGLPLCKAQEEPETCVTTQSGQVVCGKAYQNSSDSLQNSQVEDNDFRIHLKECSRSSERITCSFLVTNVVDRDRIISFIPNYSRMIALGDEFTASEVSLGQEKDGSIISKYLVFNIPIKGSITFKKIPANINKISILDIKYRFDAKGTSYEAIFRFSDIQVRDSLKNVNTSTFVPNNNIITNFGTLKAQDPKARINIRDEPHLSGNNRHYGIVGDRVVILGSTRSDGYTWYKIKFPTSGAEGWVRGDFVILKN